MKSSDLLICPNRPFRLKDFNTDEHGAFKDKAEATEKLASDIEKLRKLQDVFYAAAPMLF